MQSLLITCLLLHPAFAADIQGPHGTYAAAGASWSINAHHALIWAGQPYLPVGLRVPGTASEIARAKSAGVADLIVELPSSGAGWKEAFEALEASSFRYLIALDSLAPGEHGVAVEPQGYRVAGIRAKRRIEVQIPGAKKALALLVTQHDSEVRRVDQVPIEGGKFVYDADPPNDLDHVLLIYPEMDSWSLAGCFDTFDDHRDRLLRALSLTPPGKGLRGIVNPIGNVFRLRSERSFVPGGKLFRMELQQYLKDRYRAVETAMRAWSMSVNDIESFEGMARLVPLWSGSRGVSKLYDPTTGNLYACESKASAAWNDIEAVISAAAVRRFKNLVSSIRQICDVPVIQEWADWGSPYESGVASLDGLAARTQGTSPSELAEVAARAASSLNRWRLPGWLVASLVEMPAGPDSAGLFPSVVDDLTSMGYRAWFARPGDTAMLQAVAAEGLKKGSDSTLSTWSPRPVYFPESALNPATIMRLPGGGWWLPAPVDGNRVALGDSYFAYRMVDGQQGSFALWTRGSPGRVKLLMADPKAAVFSSIDGSDPKPRLVRGGVEVELSQLPLILTGTQELPVPEPAYKEVVERFANLMNLAAERGADTTEYAFLFQDAGAGFERNPGGSFPAMLQQADRLSERLGRHTWIEAEAVRQTTFSDIGTVPGASGGSALFLRATFAGSDAFQAEYEFSPRSSQDLVCWVAARIPAEFRKSLRVVLGGIELGIESGPIGHYSSGFAWYRMGLTQMRPGQTKLLLKVLPQEGIEMTVDAILLAHPSFTPNGLKRPAPFAG